MHPEAGSCHLAKRSSFLVRPNGEIHKCSINFENPQFIVGMLKNGEIEYNDALYEKLTLPNRCQKYKECYYAPICKGEVCPSARDKKSECPETMRHMGYILEIMDINKPFDTIG